MLYIQTPVPNSSAIEHQVQKATASDHLAILLHKWAGAVVQNVKIQEYRSDPAQEW